MHNVALAARRWHAAGFAVFAVRPDGSKAPVSSWSGEPPPLEHTQHVVTSGNSDGIGVVLGDAVCIELEGRAIERLPEISEHPLMKVLEQGCCEESPSGGRHWFFRVDGDAGPKSVPAKNASGETLAEYRTGRHFMVVAPSAGRTHTTGRAYRFLAGGPETIPTLTEAQAAEVRRLLGELNEWAASEKEIHGTAVLAPQAITYNACNDLGTLLKRHGWRPYKRPYYRRDLPADAPLSQDWTRPGRSGSKSATVTGNTLRVWSSSTPLPTEIALTAYDVAVAYGEDVSINLQYHEEFVDSLETTLEAQRIEGAERLQTEVAYAGVSGGGPILLDRSGTGGGKSHRSITVCLGKRSLCLLPTHENCRERVQEFAAQGLTAVAYPELTEFTCHPDWLHEAKQAQDLGLSIARIVCSRCPYSTGCEYRASCKTADGAGHRIATHARVLSSPGVIADAEVVVIDEQVEEVLAPVNTCSVESLDLVARIASSISGAEAIVEAVRAIRAGDIPRAIPGDDARLQLKLLRRWSKMKVNSGTFGKGIRFLLRQYTKVTIVAGQTVLGYWASPIPPGVVRIACDATAGPRLSSNVLDITPDGVAPPEHPIVQFVGIDVTKEQKASVTAQLVGRFLADHPEVKRLGIIGHRKAVQFLRHERIKMVSYFHSGQDRASNKWHKACDHLLIVGTPRVNPLAIRAEVVKAGGEDSEDGDYGPRSWEGRRANGSSVTIGFFGYRNPAWFDASKRLTRTVLQQAVGRARSVLPKGIPVTIYSPEAGIPGAVVNDSTINLWTEAGIGLLRAMEENPLRIDELAGRLGLTVDATRKRVQRASGLVKKLEDGRFAVAAKIVHVTEPDPVAAPAIAQTTFSFQPRLTVEVLVSKLGRSFKRRDAVQVLMAEQGCKRRTAYQRISAEVKAGRLRDGGLDWLNVTGTDA